MGHSMTTLGQTMMTVSGTDTLQLVQHLVQALLTLLQAAEQEDDSGEPVAVAPFQAEGRSIDELAQRLVDDVLAVITESETQLASLELANVVTTDRGWRAWGYLRFGSRPRNGTPPRISVEPAPRAEADGTLQIRLILTPDSPASTRASLANAETGQSL